MLSKPHAGITLSTISRWINRCITEAGYNLPEGCSAFTIAHSMRGNGAEAADFAGCCTQQIMAAQEGASESAVSLFYKSKHNPN